MVDSWGERYLRPFFYRYIRDGKLDGLIYTVIILVPPEINGSNFLINVGIFRKSVISIGRYR